ncbi:PhzF family phenazine biosynthesis protein, partial [candidate division GN15 bacterium]|nr:PhzF family phenazine biosynthesis protein [candidate division GN15 bacterium]
EVELCGHATLGTAHVLFSDGLAPAGSTITFHTKSGRLRARQDGEYIVLDFPALEVRPGEPVSGVIEALGVTPVGFNRTRSDYLVEVSTEQAVRQCDPDQALLKKAGVRGVIVTAGGSGDYDFVSRFFAPGAGIAEDPVTGSAHCALAPYWQKKLGKDTMLAYQASARGGEVRVTVRGDRVELAGKAVITLRGELLV